MPPGAWQAAAGVAGLALGSAAALWGTFPEAPAPRRERRVLLALWLAGLATGFALGPRPPQRPLAVPSGIARLEALVEYAQPGRDGRGYAVLRVLDGTRLQDGARVARGALLSAGPAVLPPGARIRVIARLAPGLPFRNPSPHPDPPRRFALQGRAFIADATAVKVIAQEPLEAGLEAARSHVRRRLEATLPPRAAGVARALVLGEGGAVSEEDQLDVRDAGLLHVFAVSGLHVAVLAGVLVGALRRALLYCGPLARRYDVRRLAYAAGGPLALGYAAFAGGAPSAWRAAITAALSFALFALGRRPDAVAVSALAAGALGILDPREAARPAFLLSIAATAAILAAPSEPARDLRSWLHAAVAISARTWLATAPIVWFCFGSAQVIGLLANVLLLPLGTLLLQLAAAHAVLCSLTPFAVLTASAFALSSEAFLSACALFADALPARSWPPPDVPQGAVLGCAAGALLLVRGLRARCAIALAAIVALGVLELRLRSIERPRGVLRVLFADVGQGDAALVDLPDGRLMLIDAGGAIGGGLDPGKAALVPLLAARRRDRIDIAVLTHPHPDHFGGLHALFDQLPIGELWDTGQAEAERDLEATSNEAARLLARARSLGTRVRRPSEVCGRATAAGSARIRVLWPCPRYRSAYDINDNSLVLRIDFGRRSLLFAGDAEQAAEQELLDARAVLRADVLKVGHHGSRTSTTAPFLAAVDPRLALISAGAGNRFGHPHAEVIERLRGGGRTVIELAREGGTLVTTDGRNLEIETAAGQRQRF